MISSTYPRLSPTFDDIREDAITFTGGTAGDTLPIGTPAIADVPASYKYTPVRSRPPVRRARTWRDHSYWFIGDIHGNLDEYARALQDIREIDPKAITIQVGDLELTNPKDIKFLGPRDFFIQGNHDDYSACCKHPNFLGPYGVKHGIFFMGGAKTNKGPGYTTEELTNKQLSDAIELFEQTKPEIVVTHDCPHEIRKYLFYKQDKDHTRTSDALQEMWDIHAPLVWAFGHHHWGEQEVIDGTDFVCCAPLQSHQMKLVWGHGVVERQKATKPVQMTAGKAISRFLNDWNPFKG
jgi:predicted phosphodiesterase